MARKPRIHFNGALYHVIARGNRGQKIFRDDQDYERYLSFLKECKARFRFFLYAYTLMPTHIHILLEVSETPLSRLMQILQFRYTRNFNIKYKKRGRLFQGRYKAVLCDKDSYFLELSAYIHLNPVRAGLIKDPRQYPWSSYRFYVREVKERLVDRDFLLAQFSKKKATAKREYSRFVRSRISQGHREDLYELRDQRFLGTEEFVEDIRRDLNERPSFVYDISIEEIVSDVCLVFNISKDLLYSNTRNRLGASGRAVVGYLAKELANHPFKETAAHFNRNPVVISKGLKGLEKKIREDETISTAITVLQESLTKNRKKYSLS
ncbi:MAG: transposase [Deltaproteobacteria bacterium]|nr:transposase [Deltaproteobacteria bacterium]